MTTPLPAFAAKSQHIDLVMAAFGGRAAGPTWLRVYVAAVMPTSKLRQRGVSQGRFESGHGKAFMPSSGKVKSALTPWLRIT
jgi:hypothetical protein